MDSNESIENKTLDAASKMEVLDSSLQDDSITENQLEEISSENMVIKQINRSDEVESISKEANKLDKETLETKNINSEINTLQSDSNTIEIEKKTDEGNTLNLLNSVKEIENSAEDVSSTTTVPQTELKETTEGKRKRKSPNSPLVSSSVEQNGSSETKRKKLDSNRDRFCWRCHKIVVKSVEAQCTACPRSWHRRCMGGAPPLFVTDWLCGECTGILQSENIETRSQVMAQLTIDQLCMMLKHVVERMRDQHGAAPFWKAVDLNEVPNYLEYVVKPMDLSLLESNVRAKMYSSIDAFMADARWIQHNCIVFNTCGGVYADTSKLTNTAKQMLKVARQEVSEIEACPDCFAHGRNLPRPLPSWFIEPCRKPHPIVWAKLKGFPFWPAKAMPRLNTQGLVDVRFFGEHDRAWVSPKDIYLYSQEPPVPLPKKKKLEMEQCVKEVEDHSRKLQEVFGEFKYAPPKTPYDPHDPMQIQMELPEYDPILNKRLETKKVETQTPENNKVLTPKNNKQPLNSKNIVVACTNGVIENTIEKRKLVRKKKIVNLSRESVNTLDLSTAPTLAIVLEKSKSPSVAISDPLIVDKNNSNSEQSKNNKLSEVNTIIEISNNTSPKKNITPIRKIKSDSMKKIKLVKDVEKEEIKKAAVGIQNASKKVANTIHSLAQSNGSQNNTDVVSKSPIVGQKPVTILATRNVKKNNLISANAKTNLKTQHSENKLANKVLNKTFNKEMTKGLVNNTLKNNSLISKPMTAIPMSTKKDQSKSMYLLMNTNTSESAKHFGEKEPALHATVTVIKQEPKDDVQPKLMIARKPSKARKSFPNKPPSYPQVITSSSSSYPLPKNTSNTSDAMVYIPPQNNELRSSAYELPPPEAGPVTAQIHLSSKELANRMVQLIIETIKDAAEGNEVGGTNSNHEATIHYLKLRMERMKWEHQQKISELKHNNELVLREMKANMEVERYRALQDARREAEIDKLRCIEETKRKQWCVVCGREAMFYCCWNTAYCDYPCQQKHWPSHMANCAQKTQSQQQQHKGSSTSQPQLTELKSQQQVMPKLVINRPHQSTIMRRA